MEKQIIVSAKFYNAGGLMGRVVAFTTDTHTFICQMKTTDGSGYFVNKVEVYEREDGLETFRGYASLATINRLHYCAIGALFERMHEVGANSFSDPAVWNEPVRYTTHTV